MSAIRSTYIAQGEQAIGSKSSEVISTVLGSCVSVCLWDPDARIGGMNHMLLPDAATDTLNQSAGAVDMERLINAMVRIGANRSSLRAKVFGGASMLSGITDIGERNARFAIDYLEREGIVCDAISTGGDSARQVKYWPESGAAKQRMVRDAPVVQKRVEVEVNDVELF